MRDQVLNAAAQTGLLWYHWVGIGLCALFVLVGIFGSVFTIQTQSIGVVERFGKFIRLASPGLNFKIPLVDSVVQRMSLRVKEFNVVVETKTKDNVFAKILVSVQFNVLSTKAFEAFYELADPEAQIKSYVFDLVRAEIPKLSLDETFERKDEVANAVKQHLAETMAKFGYNIVVALVTDIEPDPEVKASMNHINAAQRNRMAANEKGEADRILKVKAAQAEAEAMALHGKGVADQRRAIVDGLRESVAHFAEAMPGSTAQDAMALVLMTQYLDTMKSIGTAGGTNTIFLNNNPGATTDMASQIREAMISAGRVAPAHPSDGHKPNGAAHSGH